MKKKEEKTEEKVIFDTETVIGEPAPNVAFAGRRFKTDEHGKMKLQPMTEAPEKINTATETLYLAPSAVQVEAGAYGFYSEHAAYLKEHFKDPNGKVEGVFYKEPKKKGA